MSQKKKEVFISTWTKFLFLTTLFSQTTVKVGATPPKLIFRWTLSVGAHLEFGVG